jgi:hypothetical protein
MPSAGLIDVPEGHHLILASDLKRGIDCRVLPYADCFLDGLVLDLPYAGQGGQGTNKKRDGTPAKKSGYGTIDGYGNDLLGSRSTAEILKLYYEGAVEARRVVKRKGLMVVKCMDQVESGQLKLLHIDIITNLSTTDWTIEQLFVVTTVRPPLMRHSYQKHARQNHSYFIVARKA